MILSITINKCDIKHNDTGHNDAYAVMLSAIYAECPTAECCYAVCRYTESRGAKLAAVQVKIVNLTGKGIFMLSMSFSITSKSKICFSGQFYNFCVG
jgi:hypothetical protein